MLFPDFVQHYIKSYSYLLSPRSGSFAKMISGVLDLSYSVTLYLEFMVGCFRFIVFSLFLSHFVFLEYLISVSNAHLLHHLPLSSFFSFLFLFFVWRINLYLHYNSALFSILNSTVHFFSSIKPLTLDPPTHILFN